MLIDTHCHLYWKSLAGDLERVLARARTSGLTHIVVPGIDIETSRQAIRLAETYAEVYAAVGVHPTSLPDGTTSLAEWCETFAALAVHPKVVAIGEIGLDYYWNKTPAEHQAAWLRGQFEVAAALNLPVILHSRDSTSAVLEELDAWAAAAQPQRRGVLHSFAGTQQEAERGLALGFFLGFSGPITYKNAETTRQVAAAAPLDRLLIETDAPYLTPHPHRGQRNEPAYVALVADKLAEVRSIGPAELAEATSRNAHALFQF